MQTKGKKALYLVVIILVTCLYSTGIVFLKKKTEAAVCSVDDVWKLKTDWGSCTQDGIQTRSFDEEKKLSCIKENDIPRPETVRSCTPTCLIEDFQISDYWICKDWVQTRSVIRVSKRLCDISGVDTTTEKPCKNEENTKRVSLFPNWYTTQVSINGLSNNVYSSNRDNALIQATGKFKKLKLFVEWKTTVFDGRIIQIPEYYYFMFWINDKTPRILESSRIANNQISLSWSGVFQWIETPKKMEFNLGNAKLANSSDEGIWFKLKNYIDILNNNSWKHLPVTLYMWDGRSMSEPDRLKRIFGVISWAYLEYECENNSMCNITVE